MKITLSSPHRFKGVLLGFACLLFALVTISGAKPAHAATYATAGTITLCHEGQGATNTWESVAVTASIPSGSAFGVTFQVASASSCTGGTPSFSGTTVYTVQNNDSTPQSISSPLSKALFIQVQLTGDGTATPSVSAVSLTDSWTTDTTPPTSSLTPPATGTATGTVLLSASASDPGTTPSGVKQVDFYYSSGTCDASGTHIGVDTLGNGGTYSVNWDTTRAANGPYNVCSIATDNSGNVQTTPSTVSMTVSNTSTATVQMLAPNDGTQVSGTVTVTANTNNFTPAATSVTFKANGAVIGTTTTKVSDPNGGRDWSISWNTSSIANGTAEALTATATNGTLSLTSAPVNVTVSNSTSSGAYCVITVPTDGSVVAKSTGVTVTAHAGKFVPGVTKVVFKDGSNIIGTATSGVNDPNGGRDWSIKWNTSALTSGSTHKLTAKATNGTLNVTSSVVTVTIK